MKKKLFAILLTLCMVLSMMPSMAFATSGTTGTTEHYYYSDDLNDTMIRDYSMGFSTIYGEQRDANGDIIDSKDCC